MRKTSFILFLSFWALANADVVVMKNGDRITGSVVKKDGAKLTVKTANFGEVTLPWADITAITTDTTLTVQLANGQQVKGQLATANGQIQVGGQTVAIADVSAVRDTATQLSYERMLEPGWGELWAGNASISWAGTTGNAQTSTFAIGSTAVRATNTDRTSVYFNAVKSSAKIAGSKQDTAQAVRGGWDYSRNIRKKVFATAFNDWEFDKFQALDLRAVFGGGLGYKLVDREKTKLSLAAGIDYNHAKFDPAPAAKFTRNAAEFYWGNDLEHHIGSRTSFTEKFRMFNDLSGDNGYRMNFDLGATTQVAKWLTWNLSFSDRYLSNPAPGRKSNDTLYTTGFGITFSR